MLTGEMTDSAARVAHIGIAVTSIAAALAFYRDILGLAPGRSESADGATIVGLTLGDVQVELLEPRDPDSPVAMGRWKGGWWSCPGAGGGVGVRVLPAWVRFFGVSLSRCCSSSDFIPSAAGPRSVPQRVPMRLASFAFTADMKCASVSGSDCGAGVRLPPPHARRPSATSTASRGFTIILRMDGVNPR